MIVKFVESTDPHRADALGDYITNQHDAAEGEETGEKVTSYGLINTFSDNLDDARAEVSADDLAYSGKGR